MHVCFKSIDVMDNWKQILAGSNQKYYQNTKIYFIPCLVTCQNNESNVKHE